MKKLKSLLAFTTALCICAGYLPAPTQTTSKMLIATAEDEGTEIVDFDTCGDTLKWTLNNDGTLTISGEGAMTNWEDNTVPWCDSREKITSVVLENGVTSIGNNAFGYSGLTSIDIPDSVKTIGEGAFDNCYALESIEIPDSVTTIGKSAFIQCSALTSIEIPNSVETIGEGAFENCSALTSITIKTPDCTISESAIPANENLVIRGYTGSKAEEYANGNNRPVRKLQKLC